MNTFTKIVLGCISVTMASVVALGPAITFADTLDQKNDTTGENSTNTNRARVRTTVRERYSSRVRAENRASVSANTGDNEVEENTEAGTLTSGDVLVDAIVTNDLTQNDCGCDPLVPPDTDITQENNTTGSDSDNSNRASVRTRTSRSVRNSTNIDNSLRVRANTGDNEMEENTSGGDVTSGDVNVYVDFLNTVN